jgi:carbamoyl-phosphate synthase small subunit
MQGNYGVDDAAWESRQLWIDGFVAQEVRRSPLGRQWLERLAASDIPILADLDTREVTLRLRQSGTPWGALVQANSPEEAKGLALPLIKAKRAEPRDWVFAVSREQLEERQGKIASGPRVAVLDFGCKENTLRELQAKCSRVGVFPSRSTPRQVLDWEPNAVLLSNGPGDPEDVQVATETVRSLLGQRPIFGICMGHQILSLALGAKTFKLKFGHRGGNHPVRDDILKTIYVTSQNHGYAVDPKSLPSDVVVTHLNLNDQTVEGVWSEKRRAFSVQYHPESRPGPHEARRLFDYFIEGMIR